MSSSVLKWTHYRGHPGTVTNARTFALHLKVRHQTVTSAQPDALLSYRWFLRLDGCKQKHWTTPKVGLEGKEVVDGFRRCPLPSCDALDTDGDAG
ncbi:unnamed protein product, partial [Polarella glacialis]